MGQACPSSCQCDTGPQGGPGAAHEKNDALRASFQPYLAVLMKFIVSVMLKCSVSVCGHPHSHFLSVHFLSLLQGLFFVFRCVCAGFLTASLNTEQVQNVFVHAEALPKRCFPDSRHGCDKESHCCRLKVKKVLHCALQAAASSGV